MAGLVTKTISYTTKAPLWGVQIGAFKEVIPTSRFDNIKNVDAFVDKEGLIRYVVGHFSYKQQAESLLEVIQESGIPDAFIVEAKASGQPLISELRQMGIPVQEFVPSKGNDKIARVNAIADLFASGVIWCPDTRWARELIEQTADFPNGEHDDLVDSMSQALLRYRQGGFIRIASDDYEEPKPRRVKAYY